MRGFPKYINNREDLDNCAAEFPAQTKAFLLDILAYKDVWITTGTLSDGEPGVSDDTHRVLEDKDMDDVVRERYQQELMEDPSPNGPIKRYGFSDSQEMSDYISSIVER